VKAAASIRTSPVFVFPAFFKPDVVNFDLARTNSIFLHPTDMMALIQTGLAGASQQQEAGNEVIAQVIFE
jgi:hypothetical protein